MTEIVVNKDTIKKYATVKVKNVERETEEDSVLFLGTVTEVSHGQWKYS